jgi:hypothetical protein
MVVGKNNENIAIATFSLGLLLAGQSFAQSGSVVQQGGAGHAAQAKLCHLEAHGPADQSGK